MEDHFQDKDDSREPVNNSLREDATEVIWMGNGDYLEALYERISILILGMRWSRLQQ